MKNKIHFIINSRSEKALTELLKQLALDPFWQETHDCFLWKSLYKGHALELTRKAIQDNTSLVIACGGDGTINEIARYLVDTAIPLGVIPLGSGNGVARHFKIPLNIKGALAVLREMHSVVMDAGLANQHFFLSNMGVSFDSEFINTYQKSRTRGFSSYFKALITAIKLHKTQTFVVSHAGIKREVSPFLLMISNANQFGYNFSLTPKALVSDGQFELILFKSKSIWSLFKLFLASRFGLKLSDKILEIIPISEVVIESATKEFLIQLDGETNRVSNEHLQIKMHPTGLHVIVPAEHR